MPPKVKIRREDVLRAAVEIVRETGAAALNARNIAAMPYICILLLSGKPFM